MVDLATFKALFFLLENARFWRSRDPEIPGNHLNSLLKISVSFAKRSKVQLFHEKVTFLVFFLEFEDLSACHLRKMRTPNHEKSWFPMCQPRKSAYPGHLSPE